MFSVPINKIKLFPHFVSLKDFIVYFFSLSKKQKQYQYALEIFFAYFNNFALVMAMVKKKIQEYQNNN